MTEISAPTLRRLHHSIANDGSAVFLTFELADDTQFQCGLNRDAFSQLVSAILNVAIQTAAKTTPDNQQTALVNQEPLPVAQIGVGKGRSGSEAILSIHFGLLQLLFATEPSTLLGMCENLQSVPWEQSSREPQ